MCKYRFLIDMMSMKMRKMRRKCLLTAAPQNDCACHICSADLSPEVTKLGVMIYICISFDTVC